MVPVRRGPNEKKSTCLMGVAEVGGILILSCGQVRPDPYVVTFGPLNWTDRLTDMTENIIFPS